MDQRRDRDTDTTLSRIEGSLQHIDMCTHEMKECERKIDDYHGRIRHVLEVVKQRKAEVEPFKQEAD